LFLGLAGPASAGVLFSEDFSAATPGPHGLGQIPGTQFSVDNLNVDIIGVLNGSFFGCSDNPGGNCLDLVGEENGGGVQSIPTFNLKAGSVYTLTFGENLQGYAPGSSATTQIQVSLGTLSQDLTFNGGINTPTTVTFKPTTNQSNAILAFETLVPADAVHGAVIDHVQLSVSGGVPEPATWAMMLIGVAGLGGLARRRRAAGLCAA
jgi:hypothetical protein